MVKQLGRLMPVPRSRFTGISGLHCTKDKTGTVVDSGFRLGDLATFSAAIWHILVGSCHFIFAPSVRDVRCNMNRI